MLMRRVCVLTALLVLTVAALPALAQRPPRIRVQQDLSDRSFRIRVVNQLDIPIYYKLVGGRNKSYVHQTLRPGESEREQATGGEKVLCVWDLDNRVIMACVVFIDRNGKIVLGGSGNDEPPSPAPALPRMEMAPESE
jgi:hypothetical protein